MIATEHRLALPAGYQLGKYRFKGVLGAGGFGITYLADDHTLGRRVAIKELLPNEIATRLDGTTVIAKTKSEEGNLAWARERFLEEGRALAACEHPNVVHVYEMIEANGTAYMVTKYEDGRSLAEWFTNLGRRPDEAELRGLLDPLLSGLDKVHRAGFLHRDIKPENIYITDDGRPLLLDFGSARQAVTGSKLLTSIVTIGYAPFEQYYEDGKQGAWSDIYALAGVMYRGIHGEKPPEATRRIKNDTCVTLAKKYAGQYTAQFLNAIDKALAVEHKDRPQSVMIWRGLLGKGAVAAQPDMLAVSPHEAWMERLRQVATIVFDHPRTTASVAAVGVLFCGWAIWKAVSPTPTPNAYPEPKPTLTAEVTPPPSFKSDGTSSSGPLSISTPVPSTPQALVVGPTPSKNPGVDNWIPNFTPGPAAGPIVDPKLVGTWTTKVTGPSGFVVMRWEQLEDGRYSLSRAGSTIDTGTLSCQGGVMHQISAVTHATFDTPYEFKSTKLQTTGANDPSPVLWTRVTGSTGSKSGNTSSRSKGSGEGSSHSGSGSGSTDWQRYIPRNAPSHGIPHLPF
ncbi:MAG: protein kinase [Chthoniobacter sp.]|uniref:serine/threonine protein kinase n=1 Tax=Chthoniobacter sp. TaxID=2510640 RepID=UPI0032AAA2C6